MAKQHIDTPNEYLGKAEQFNIDEIGDGPKDIEIIDRVVSGCTIQTTPTTLILSWFQ